MSKEEKEKEQIRLLENKIHDMTEGEPPIDDMWNTIEKVGIKRELLDPYDELDYSTVHDIYLTIKNRNSPTKGNKKKNQ